MHRHESGEFTMEFRFADRMQRAPKSFLGELFRVSRTPGLISFAGGLPSTGFIDTEGIARAGRTVMDEEGKDALQYSTTDGYLPLREYIAARYRSRLGIPATADEIQIVNGSQQCLDLVAKIFLNPGDPVAIEQPGYLGAIESFSLYEPVLHPIPVTPAGPDLSRLETLVWRARIKFFYAIPNSQNPSGLTYPEGARKGVAAIMKGTGSVFYEDDAFGELFFDGKPRVPVKKYLPDQTILSGSFSKIVAPGMRIGWIFAPAPVLARFNVAKQAADLHSNYLCQKILHRYLETFDLDAHVRKISAEYGRRCRLICDLMDDRMPYLTHTNPEGGMFLIATLPRGTKSMDVFETGIRKGVAVLPGTPFYVNGGGQNIIRLNFSCTEEEEIKTGMQRLESAFREIL